MWTRPLGDTLTDIAGSVLDLNSLLDAKSGDQRLMRTTSVGLSLPMEVKIRRDQSGLVFCADVPSWRWRTDWDPPYGQLRLTLEEAPLEISA